MFPYVISWIFVPFILLMDQPTGTSTIPLVKSMNLLIRYLRKSWFLSGEDFSVSELLERANTKVGECHQLLSLSDWSSFNRCHRCVWISLLFKENPNLIEGDIIIDDDTEKNADPCTSSGCKWGKWTDGKVYIPYYIANHFCKLKSTANPFLWMASSLNEPEKTGLRQKLNVFCCYFSSLPWKVHHHTWSGILLLLFLHPL